MNSLEQEGHPQAKERGLRRRSQTSSFQNCEEIYFCWCFVMATLANYCRKFPKFIQLGNGWIRILIRVCIVGNCKPAEKRGWTQEGLKLEKSLSLVEAAEDTFLLTVLHCQHIHLVIIVFSIMSDLLKYLACLKLSSLLYMLLFFLYMSLSFLSKCPSAAITKYHKLCSLKQQKFVLLQFQSL